MKIYRTLSLAILLATVPAVLPTVSYAAEDDVGASQIPRFSHGGAAPYSGVWNWEKVTAEPTPGEGMVKLTTGRGAKGASGTFPWWYLLLLQGSSSEENIRALVQSILHYLGRLQLANNEKENVVAPSTPNILGIGANFMKAADAVNDTIVSSVAAAGDTGIRTLPFDADFTKLPRGVNNPFAIHIDKYCSAEDIAAELCPKTATVSTTPNADLVSTTLLNKDVLSTETEQAAARNFIQVIFPPRVVRKPMQMKDGDNYIPAALTKIGMQWSGVARQSLGEAIFYRFLQERIPVTGLKIPGGGTENVSIKQLMRHEASWRYESDNWKQSINSAPTNALLREIANMEAYRMYLEYQQLQRMDELAALLAIMTATANPAALADTARAVVETGAAPYR